MEGLSRPEGLRAQAARVVQVQRALEGPEALAGRRVEARSVVAEVLEALGGPARMARVARGGPGELVRVEEDRRVVMAARAVQVVRATAGLVVQADLVETLSALQLEQVGQEVPVVCPQMERMVQMAPTALRDPGSNPPSPRCPIRRYKVPPPRFRVRRNGYLLVGAGVALIALVTYTWSGLGARVRATEDGSAAVEHAPNQFTGEYPQAGTSNLATLNSPADNTRTAAVIKGLEDSRSSEIMKVGDEMYFVEWEGNLRRLRFASGALRAEEVVIDGKLDGHSTVWHESGSLHCQGSYRANREEGEWVYFADTSQVIATGRFVGGKKEGTWTTWFATGQLESMGAYSGGLRVGTWSFWEVSSGRIDDRRSGFYENGHQQSVESPVGHAIR